MPIFSSLLLTQPNKIRISKPISATCASVQPKSFLWENAEVVPSAAPKQNNKATKCKRYSRPVAGRRDMSAHLKGRRSWNFCSWGAPSARETRNGPAGRFLGARGLYVPIPVDLRIHGKQSVYNWSPILFLQFGVNDSSQQKASVVAGQRKPNLKDVLMRIIASVCLCTLSKKFTKLGRLKVESLPIIKTSMRNYKEMQIFGRKISLFVDRWSSSFVFIHVMVHDLLRQVEVQVNMRL